MRRCGWCGRGKFAGSAAGTCRLRPPSLPSCSRLPPERRCARPQARSRRSCTKLCNRTFAPRRRAFPLAPRLLSKRPPDGVAAKSVWDALGDAATTRRRRWGPALAGAPRRNWRPRSRRAPPRRPPRAPAPASPPRSRSRRTRPLRVAPCAPRVTLGVRRHFEEVDVFVFCARPKGAAPGCRACSPPGMQLTVRIRPLAGREPATGHTWRAHISVA